MTAEEEMAVRESNYRAQVAPIVAELAMLEKYSTTKLAESEDESGCFPIHRQYGGSEARVAFLKAQAIEIRKDCFNPANKV